MISSLQPQRPKLPPTRPLQNPMNQQPHLSNSSFVSTTSQILLPSTSTTPASLLPTGFSPRTQIEALPPFPPYLQTQTQVQTPSQTPTYALPHSQIHSQPTRINANMSENETSWQSRITQYQQAQAVRLRDPAQRHPVFFTDRLVKAPTGVLTGSGGESSPVCRGYVWEDGRRAMNGNGNGDRVKL